MNPYRRAALLLLLLPSVSAAQIDPEKVLKMDFAVPDAPAFKVLGVTPEKILRPGSPRDLGIALSPFVNEAGKIPNGFAAEISPSLVYTPRLPDYAGNAFSRILYNARLSIGTGDILGQSALAFGYRFTLFDGTDPLLDEEYKRHALEDLRGRVVLADTIAQMVKAGLMKEFPSLQEDAIDEAVSDVGAPAKAEDSPQTKRAKRMFRDLYDSPDRLDAWIELCRINPKLKDAQASAARRLDYLKNNWSKNILELGVAHLHASPDSSYGRLMVQRYQLWLTWGIRVGAETQLVLGASGSISRDTQARLAQREFNGALRGYFGSNSVKAFLEADLSSRTGLYPEYDAMLGGEFRIAEGIWVEAGVGVKTKTGGEGVDILKSLSLRYGM